MKIKTLLAVSLVTFFVACGDNSNTKNNSSNENDKEVKKVEQEKPYEIKFSHVVAPDTPKGMAAEFFKTKLEDLSDGRIIVKIYPNGSYSSDSKVLNELDRGNIQMVAPSTATYVKIVKEMSFFDLPYISTNYKHLHTLYASDIGKEAAQKVVDINPQVYMPIAYWDSGFKQMCSRKSALLSPDDSKGQKSRVMPSKILEDEMRSVGSLPVSMPFGEVYNALNQGTIDMAENPLSNYYNSKFYEACTHLTMTNHGFISYLVMLDKRFYDSLPQDLQSNLMKALEETTKYERDLSIRDENRLFDILQDMEKNERRPKIITLTDEQLNVWKSSMQTIYKDVTDLIPMEWIEKAQKMEPLDNPALLLKLDK